MNFHAMQLRCDFQRSKPALVRAVCGLLVALPCLSLVLNALALVQYGVDLPFWDDWRQYHNNRLGDLSLSHLFRPVNDTLFPVGKFLDAMAIRWLDGHSVVYQLISMLSVLGALLALQWRLLSLCIVSPVGRATAFFFTLPMLQSDSYWGLQNLAYHQAIPLICVLSILCLALDQTRVKRALVPSVMALGLIAGMAYISGAVAALGLSVVLFVAGQAISRGSVGPSETGGISASITLGLRLQRVGIALFLPGLICTLAQLWVLVLVQNGSHLTGISMAYPWEGDFWWYILGKIGRALLLDRHQPALSLGLVVLIVAVVALVFAQSVRFLKVAGSSARQTRVSDAAYTTSFQARNDTPLTRSLGKSLIFVSLVVVIGLYLGLVAAGRAHFRPATIQHPLQVFTFGFMSFHFFWICIAWPWLVACLWPTSVHGKRANTRVYAKIWALVAFMLVILWGTGSAFDHSSAYKEKMALRHRGLDCINEKIAAGIRPISCPSVHLIDSPDLLPDDLSGAIRHALEHNVSFVQNLRFPFITMGATQPAAMFSLLQAPGVATLFNVDVQPDAAIEPYHPLELIARTHNPYITFSTGNADALQRCLILDVSVHLSVPVLDTIHFYFVPATSEHVTNTNVKSMPTDRAGAQTLSARMISASGFSDDFRLSLGHHPVPVTLYDLELRCRF